MIRDGKSVSGDLFLDYGVKGNTFSRSGLNALFERVKADSTVSHIMIPRRDWLARPYRPEEDGTRVRKLDEGEHVKMCGHHVVWLPEPGNEWGTVQRILKMLETMSASQVAKTLKTEGIPTPDHGRCRKDNGVLHSTSGVWNATAISNIARNPLLRGEVECR